MADAPVLRSPVVVPADDQLISDESLLTKVQVRGGDAESSLRVGSGRTLREKDGTLVVGSGPGEWLLLAPAGQGSRLLARARSLTGFVTAVDLTHGRAMLRIRGENATDVMALVCGIDLSDAVTPDGTALRTAVAGVATDVIRDDVAGVRSYLLHVERSSGQYLYDTLSQAAMSLTT